jgi:hypothetical protein
MTSLRTDLYSSSNLSGPSGSSLCIGIGTNYAKTPERQEFMDQPGVGHISLSP